MQEGAATNSAQAESTGLSNEHPMPGNGLGDDYETTDTTEVIALLKSEIAEAHRELELAELRRQIRDCESSVVECDRRIQTAESAAAYHEAEEARILRQSEAEEQECVDVDVSAQPAQVLERMVIDCSATHACLQRFAEATIRLQASPRLNWADEEVEDSGDDESTVDDYVCAQLRGVESSQQMESAASR